MQKVLISVYDKVADLYSAPMVEPNVEVAKRNFKMGVAKNQMIMTNPGDFELVVIGYFNDQPLEDQFVIAPLIDSSISHRFPVSEILGIRPDTIES